LYTAKDKPRKFNSKQVSEKLPSEKESGLPAMILLGTSVDTVDGKHPAPPDMYETP